MCIRDSTYTAEAGGSEALGLGWGQQGEGEDPLDDPQDIDFIIPYTIGTDVSESYSGESIEADRLRVIMTANESGGAAVTITGAVAKGTGTNPFNGGGGGGGGSVATIYSTDNGATFASEVEADSLTGDDGGFDVIRVGAQVYVGIDDEVQSAEDGGAYSSATGGGCAGSYPLCIWAYGTDAIKYLFSTAAAVGGETLWYVEGGSATAITPNDGANDGIVATADSLCTDPASDDHIFGLFAFSGTVKFAYSPDQGTSWQFNTQVSDDACYIRCKYVSGHYHVYICDAAILWYGQWNGLSTSSITLHAKGTPSAAIKGVEIR